MNADFICPASRFALSLHIEKLVARMCLVWVLGTDYTDNH